MRRPPTAAAEAIAELRRRYSSQLPAKTQAIAQAMGTLRSEHDSEKAFHLAHRLAGSAAIHQFHAVSRAARAIEKRLSGLVGPPSRWPDAARLELQALAETLVRAAGEVRGGPPPGTILLVDDDQDMLDYLELHLRAAGYRVESVRDGATALGKLETSRPDLIVADVKMPGMSGYELCRRIRQDGHDDIPFIFLSALGNVPQRILGLRMGADDYLVKPTSPEELVLKISAQIEKRRQLEDLRKEAQRRSGLLAGSLADVSVPEVLQMASLLELPRLRITLEREPGTDGVLFLERGRFVHAETGGLSGRKALFRMLGWRSGAFRVDDEPFPGERTLSERVDEAVLEGVAYLDEFRALLGNLPLDGPYLVVRESPERLGRRFEQSVAEVLALVERHHHVDDVLDHSPASDLETLRILSELLETDVIAGHRERRRGGLVRREKA